MPKKTTLDNKAAEGEQDPMAIRKSKKLAKLTKSKIKKTGLKKAYCDTCKKTLSIARFTVHKTGDNRKRPKEKSTKPRKNTPSAPYSPLRNCNKCLGERKKQDGRYEKLKEAKRIVYKSSTKMRKSLREAAKTARALLSDSYIKKLLKAKGCTSKQIKENPQLIKNKRQEIKDKRESAANKTHEVRRKTGFYRRRDITELKAGYVRGVIKRGKNYKGEEITDEMVEEKRKELIYERIHGEKPGVVRRTAEQKKETIRITYTKRLETLDDVYIRSRLKKHVNYRGEEITEEMMKACRAEIEEYRDRRSKGIKALSYADQITDAYVRKIIYEKNKIPKDQITDYQIVVKRAEIIELRLKRANRKVEKQRRAELRAQREIERKEAAVLDYKCALEEAAERRKKKLARLKAIADRKSTRQAKKDIKVAQIKEKKENAAQIAIKMRLLETHRKYEEKVQLKELQKQKEKERLENKEAKKKAKAAARKVERLAKKVKKVQTTPVYNFFTPYELRHQNSTGS